MLSLLAFAAAAPAQAVEPTASEAVIGRLFAAIERQDKSAFLAIAPDAQLASGDTGVAMSFERMSAILGTCEAARQVKETKHVTEKKPYSTVSVRMRCHPRGASKARLTMLDFNLHDGQVITGVIALR
jgi:hypothetical protein